jgi:lysophospholipase L1-like esterase
MKYFIQLSLFTFYLSSGIAQQIKIKDPVHFLALGDSYTIGQSVSLAERWPSKLAIELTNRGYTVSEVKYIAQTGWRTDNLKYAIEQQQPLTGFNLVSLLIGVNNQYQGGTTAAYYTEFDNLLKTALTLASNKPEHVFVLSIPDYAYTPYGNGSSVISSQIDQFNSINKIITDSYRVKYIDITPISRMGLMQPELVASDGLHPSAVMYGLWVREILESIEKEVGLEDDNPVTKSGLLYTLAQRQLTIKSAKQKAAFYISNSTGQIVIRGQISANYEKTVNLGGLPAGMYFLRFENDKNILLRTKFVLQ